MKRRGLIVALVGADGAGKTTLARHLCARLPAATYVYMGTNPAASNHLLPTTRLIRRLKRRSGRASGGQLAASRSGTGRPVRPAIWCRLLAPLSLVNRVADELFRYAILAPDLLRGRVVLLDRDFLIDYRAADRRSRAERPLVRRAYGWFLTHLYPRPDLVIYLDAPAEVLFARKDERSLEFLERRREDYRQVLQAIRRSAVVDASRPIDEVEQQAAAAIEAAGRQAERVIAADRSTAAARPMSGNDPVRQLPGSRADVELPDDLLTAGLAKRPPEADVAVQPPQRVGERRHVARRNE